MRADRRALALLALVAVVAAAVALAAWRTEHGARARDASRIAALEAEAVALRERVAEEASARAALMLETQQLRAALEQASPDAGSTSGRAEPAEGSGPASPEDAALSAEPAPSAPGEAGLVGPASFDPAPLLAAGFRPDQVERFRERLDEIELARLYLRDRATREGWLETPRYREESRALGQEFRGLRDEFDEDFYDWALFSTGHPNRVAVTEVLSGSAAQSAGLQPGDLIVRYDGRLVLSASELREATLAGRVGELVAVEVQRAEDPAPLRVFVPRGPLGVRMTPTRETPPPAG
ncbi:PDZ domain-containing protein [Myxococcota bacterium]|nr:PDZ domain-containing protein [Myxococcota bacterium]MCZ7617616.1 PDZ domain-containing protein [Myxococcota bacterium]